jgi:hypothetical protein
MALMVKLANAKNALVSVKTAISCLIDVEYLNRKDFVESALYSLRKAEFKLERDVEFLQNLFDNTYVKFIPANKETV